MKLLPLGVFGLLAILSLTACKGGGDPVEQALREEAAEHHAQATQATAKVEAATPTTVAGAATTTTASDSYRAELIAEHRRTIAKAERALADIPDPETRRLAQAELDRSREALASLEAASAR